MVVKKQHVYVVSASLWSSFFLFKMLLPLSLWRNYSSSKIQCQKWMWIIYSTTVGHFFRISSTVFCGTASGRLGVSHRYYSQYLQLGHPTSDVLLEILQTRLEEHCPLKSPIPAFPSLWENGRLINEWHTERQYQVHF